MEVLGSPFLRLVPIQGLVLPSPWVLRKPTKHGGQNTKLIISSLSPIREFLRQELRHLTLTLASDGLRHLPVSAPGCKRTSDF